MQGEQMLELSSGLAPASLPNVARRSVVGILAYISSPAPCQLVWNGVDLSRSGSRQVFWPIRFDLQLKTHASIGYGGTPLPACLAVSKVLLVERVAHFVPF
ncbi:MAG: hypothetical protein KDA51_08025, partial [Planctomycetales bacterium]|nr:hypothetical protein [Planctomycetales bacterium]